MSEFMTENEWFETHYDNHRLEADLPHGLSVDAVLEIYCRDCGLCMIMDVWNANENILIVDQGNGSCIEEERE